MPGFKKKACHSIFLFMLSALFVACGTMTSPNPPAGDNQLNYPAKLSDMEDRLLELQNEQASLKARVQTKETSIHALQESISTLEQKISSLEKKTLSLTQMGVKTGPGLPSDLYQRARTLMAKEKYTAAATLFTELIRHHPHHSLADNAVYWLGECHYSLADYKRSILVFKDLETIYPKSEKVPDAILKIGYAYLSLDDTNRAHHYLKKVLKNYPFSLAAEKAQAKLGDFQ